jgi:photosystem II stability/assembly factor-like uncharacterized protein
MTTRPQSIPRRQHRSANQSQRPGILTAAIALVAVVLLAGAAYIAFSGDDAAAAFMPVDTIEHEYSPNHLHGIGYDPERNRLYLASHFGLFALEDGQLHQLGDERSDFMGFAMHPEDSTEILVSGHPQGGGNLGLMHSTDEGLTFEQIFTGVSDEVVDFHSMTISPADPDWIYGAFMGQIYRSENGGHDFVAFVPEGLPDGGLCWGVPCLAADSSDPGTVYAGTQAGLKVSHDGGQHWADAGSDLGQVAAVAVDPETPGRIVAYTEMMGLAETVDGGETWESRQGNMPVVDGGIAFAIALDPTDPNRMYVATMNNDVFETTDRGETWQPVDL